MSAPDRVPLTELKDLLVPGELPPFRIVDAQGRLLLAAGQRIADEGQLEAMIERGACAEPEEVAQARRERGAPAVRPVETVVRQPTWFDAWERQVWTLDRLLRSMDGDPAGTGRALAGFVDEQLRLVDLQPDAALFLAVRQDDRRFALYALSHAMHTATVACLTARQLGWAAPRVRSVVAAALTMNASIVELQARMAEQEHRPTPRQIEEIRGHPHRSAAMLRACGVADDEWLGAVEDHHEHPGGGGYPRGLHAVGELAHLLRAADVFTAKISPRALRSALRAQVAARQLFQDEGGGPVAVALIKAVGIHPPGEIVSLRSGETAVVSHRAEAGNAPRVVVIRGANGRPPTELTRRDTSQPEHAVAGPATVQPDWPRVLPEQVYGLLPP